MALYNICDVQLTLFIKMGFHKCHAENNLLIAADTAECQLDIAHLSPTDPTSGQLFCTLFYSSTQRNKYYKMHIYSELIIGNGIGAGASEQKRIM